MKDEEETKKREVKWPEIGEGDDLNGRRVHLVSSLEGEEGEEEEDGGEGEGGEGDDLNGRRVYLVSSLQGRRRKRKRRGSRRISLEESSFGKQLRGGERGEGRGGRGGEGGEGDDLNGRRAHLVSSLKGWSRRRRSRRSSLEEKVMI